LLIGAIVKAPSKTRGKQKRRPVVLAGVCAEVVAPLDVMIHERIRTTGQQDRLTRFRTPVRPKVIVDIRQQVITTRNGWSS
jgi:hypothetical protein